MGRYKKFLKFNNAKTSKTISVSAECNPPLKKKMAAVHFTTIPCEPNTAREVQGSRILVVFVHVLSKLFTLGLKVLQRFCTFLSAIFKVPCATNHR